MSEQLVAEPRVVFGNTVDGMMNKALAGKMSARLRDRLKQEGLDLDLPIRPGYPYEDWKRWSALVATEVFPELAESERYRQLGRTVVFGIRHTALGKAIEVVLRVIGPHRALDRMNRNFRSSDNFTRVEIKDLGPQALEIRVNEVMEQPSYMQGVFEAIVEISGGKECQVEVREVALPAASYVIRWS